MTHFALIRRDVQFRRAVTRRRRREFPCVTAALVLLCSGLFLLALARGLATHAFHSVFDIIGFGSAWYGIDGQLGALTPTLFVQGQEVRLVTYMFLHLGVLHFALNMTALLGAARIERTFGHLRFLGIYLICGITGGVGGWVLVAHLNLPITAGASAALYGVFVAYEMLELLHFRAWHASLRRQLFIFAACWLLPTVIGNVTGHLVGAGTGAVLAVCLAPQVRRELARERRKESETGR